MSSGGFEAGRYSTNDGDVYACRAQPESKGLTLGGVANSYPTGAVTQKTSANLTGSSRQNGVTARRIRVRLTATLAGYLPNAVLTVPIFNTTLYNGVVPNAVGTYLGTAVIFVGRTAESVK